MYRNKLTHINKKIALVAAAAVYAISGVAYASGVSSGMIWQTDVIVPTSGCVGGYLAATVADLGTSNPAAIGEINAKQCTNINPGPIVLPGGWLGVGSGTYMNGGYCGSQSYSYTSLSDSRYLSGDWVCPNPPGAQTFQTFTNGQIWTGNGYATLGSQWSPAATF